MEASAKLQQEGEEYDLKVEVEEEEVGLLRRQSTTRKYGVHEGGVSGNGDSSTDSSRSSKNGTHAEEEPEAGQEWVEEVNGGENDVEEKGPETEAEQEPGEEREAAPERDEVDENGSNGGTNGKGDVAVLAPAAKTEPHFHSEVKVNESTWTNTVHFDSGRGTESIQTIVKTEYSDIKRVSYETETVHEASDVATETFSAFLSSQVDHQDEGISEDEIFLDSALLSPRKSSEETNTYSKESKVVEEVDLIEELNPEETEFDVKKVLEKQNTHDLYCPNCRSCITRRVILRRKKRKPLYVRHSDKIGKPTGSQLHAQAGTAVKEDLKPITIGINEAPTPAVINIPTPAVNDQPDDRDREAFRCLSCFSIFIPKGDGFKLFWPFKEREDAKKLPDPSEVPVAKDNAVTETSQMHIEHTDSTKVTEHPDAFVSPTEGTPRTTEVPSDTGLLNSKVTQPMEIEKETNDLNKESSINTERDPGETLAANGQSPEDANTKPLTVELIPPSTPTVPVVGTTSKEIYPKPITENTEELPAVSAPSAITGVKPSPAQPSPAEPQKEGDVIVEIDTLTEPTSDVAAQPGTQTLPEEPPVVQPHQPREWDILKSIVYGGLIELITSLAVVSSAAGAGAATLNTLGLGLANLFGGLIVIGHNLRELKNEQPSQGTEQVDQYQEVLGKRQHFPRHAIVAILSFIIFGCVAPITYAFSFRESDNRDYKLAAVAAASLLCIFLLAIGKAYVRKPPKAYFETVLHYVIMGFMASGISFLVGELIDELLTKLGWFNLTSSLSGTGALETGTMQSGWASY
ncbi:hypothetical protein ACJRO7_001529 [Eucalyptus globulus]|uniref:Membrane protein of ER body-like protein n=1 Tax=Eucalyptus globulus TaxID=34317 RepID=A0ABD3LS87_EUCGL